MPPPAPPLKDESFQTTSPVFVIDVPPTERTFGWLAGSMTDKVELSMLSFTQPVEPVSPASAATDWP